MFVRQLNRRFASVFSEDYGREIMTREQARRVLVNSKKVRCKDYVYSIETTGAPVHVTHTTTANWFFILCNASFWLDPNHANDCGARVTFEDCPVKRAITAVDISDADIVPAALVFGEQERGGRFEEYKNLFWVLGDRINVTIDAYTGGNAARGALLLSGIEIDLGGV